MGSKLQCTLFAEVSRHTCLVDILLASWIGSSARIQIKGVVQVDIVESKYHGWLCIDLPDSGCMRVFGGCQCALPIHAWPFLEQIHSPISMFNSQSRFSILNLIACRFTKLSSSESARKDTSLPNNEVQLNLLGVRMYPHSSGWSTWPSSTCGTPLSFDNDIRDSQACDDGCPPSSK